MTPEQLPRRFMLTRPGEHSRRPVAYGLGRPGGSVIYVSRPPAAGLTFHSSDTAEQCAFIIDGDIEWIDDEPTA